MGVEECELAVVLAYLNHLCFCNVNMGSEVSLWFVWFAISEVTICKFMNLQGMYV